MLQVISDGTTWAQISIPTGAKNIRAFASSLRRCGYQVTVVALGSQVTEYGLCKLTMIDVRGQRTMFDRDVIANVAARYGFQA